ncbi:Mago-bind domain-containing protein [Cephalotus follicularis]|uniref:Mago-bind domain-containing protein n=1 Tax=Cephalotus follicularis TaxID=3775 RepID=A0A1Q3BHD4_CEPFO|nr:Mago-bind domain-containing protein [Cephalotus follicularis]
MATISSNGGGGGGGEEVKQMAELSKTLKQGERILAPTRRPDGTLRKPIRIRAGYVPQEEVAIYQSKGALWKKEMESQLPPGYDPDLDMKPKSKSVKRNERKKEKRIQAALEKGKNVESVVDGDIQNDDGLPVENSSHGSDSVKSLASQMNELAVSANSTIVNTPLEPTETSDIGGPFQDMDKKIRALKKKIRLAEAQQQKTAQLDMKPEQSEKLTKIEGWREELKLLEDKKAELAAS